MLLLLLLLMLAAFLSSISFPALATRARVCKFRVRVSLLIQSRPPALHCNYCLPLLWPPETLQKKEREKKGERKRRTKQSGLGCWFVASRKSRRLIVRPANLSKLSRHSHPFSGARGSHCAPSPFVVFHLHATAGHQSFLLFVVGGMIRSPPSLGA